MRRYLTIIFCIAFGLPVFAQEAESEEEERKSIVQSSDTTETFVFSSYHLDENNRKVYMPLDTALGAQHIYSPLEKITPSWSAQTNLGQGARSNEFFKRSQKADFIFWQPYEPYWQDANETQYFNLSSPFTYLQFAKAQRTSGNEQIVKILHARNFSDKFSVGLRYNVISAPGISGHRNRARHGRFEALLKYTGLRYQLHASGSSTKIETQHNGGFVEGHDYFHRDSLQMTLTTASDLVHDMQIYVDQEYLIGPKDSIRYKDKPSKAVVKAWASLKHKVHYRRNYRFYKDTKLERLSTADVEEAQQPFRYYPNAFMNETATSDSMHFSQLKNTFDLEIKEGFVPRVNFGLRVGLVHEFNQVYNFRDYLFTDKNKDDFQSWGVTGAIFNRVSDYWSWKGNAYLYMDGYRQEDMSIKGEINRYFYTKNDSSFIKLSGEMSRIRPNYFLNNYYSNHYQWENDFNKEENIRASLHYIDPRLRLDFGVDAQQTNNFVYIGKEGNPRQTSESMLTYAVSLRKKFTFFRHWGFNNVIVYQHTTNQSVLHLPKWITYQSFFYDRSAFKDALRFQLGVDFTMTAKFKGAYFNPAIGMYQIQNEKKVGEFPIITAFLNMRIRTAHVFLKFYNMYQYYNQDWHPTSAYAVDSYAMFRFGVNWYFTN